MEEDALGGMNTEGHNRILVIIEIYHVGYVIYMKMICALIYSGQIQKFSIIT